MDNLIGKTLDGLYTIRELIGTGGMANVYKAVVTAPGGPVPEGTVVAVKVLRQELMHDADLVRRFKNESKAISLLNHPNIVKVYDVSVTDRLQFIVMEYIDGISVSHPDELLAAGYDLKEIGTKLVDNYATQVLDEGFFHADPHPGNIMVRGGQIVLLDLGMTGRLNAKTRSVLKDMIFAVAEQDSPKLADGLLRFAGAEADPEDYPALLADLDVIVKEFGTVDLAELDIAAMLTALTQMAQRHGIEVPSTVTTVGRALVTLEGLLDEFIPDVNMIQIISDHIAASTSKKDFVKDETKSLALESHQALHSLLAAANEMKVASRMLTRGQLRVNMEMVGSQEPIHLLANMVNRLTMALIVVGLFIGSSIVYYAGINPVIFGIPIVGFLGYVIAFILSVWIVFDIYFKGRDSKKRKPGVLRCGWLVLRRARIRVGDCVHICVCDCICVPGLFDRTRLFAE